jgi:N-acetyl-anhydromuramyl-L-alanine amidase AmpD
MTIWLLSSSAWSTADTSLLHPRPITFNAERESLTLEYRRRHQDPAAVAASIQPEMIVLHHTGTPTWRSAWQTFDHVRAVDARPELAKAGAVNVSVQYLVDRDGTIMQLMPDTLMARHCIGLNHVAIGVENVGAPPKWPLTRAQMDADAALVRVLKLRHPGIRWLIGHHEASRFVGRAPYMEREPGYRDHKVDPGAAFMDSVRARVADLYLEGAPR